MLVAWLLATNHAVFELGDLMDSGFSSAHARGDQQWHEIENTLTQPRTEVQQEAGPAQPSPVPLVPHLTLASLVVPAPQVLVVLRGDPATRPVHTWRFDQRAAPLPGAPAFSPLASQA